MKLILLLFVLLILSACTNIPRTNTDKRAEVYDYNVITIDHCEYIFIHAHTSSEVLTHKGNCTNHPIQSYIK